MRVCIIGAGLSSLTLAKALVNHKIYVELLVQKKAKVSDKSRTLGISKSNVEFFNNHIINIEKFIWKLKKIEIFTDNLKNEKLLNFENNKDQLFSVIKNFDLYRTLEKSLSTSKYFTKIYSKKNSVLFEDYNLVINTDISNPITKKYFSKKIVKKYNSYAFTTIINHEKIKNDVATQIFTKKGPLAFLPISNNKTSVIYSLHNSSDIREKNINELIHSYNLKYKIKKIQSIKTFELKSLSLRSYYHNNILAFGDLLHRIHPLAGQGFNMTIRDIKILINIIKEKYNLGLPLDESVNSEFEKKLKHKNFIFLNGIDLIHEFFNLERKTKNTILSKSVQLLGKNSYINKIFTSVADKGITF